MPTKERRKAGEGALRSGIRPDRASPVYYRQLALLVLWALVLLPDGYAQLEDVDSRRVAFYRHVEPGQSSMQVRLWGDVSSPGLYEVEAGTDLLELVFLAGGPSGGIGRSDEKQQTTLVLSRKANNVWSIIFEADLEDITGRQQPYPSLQDGDALRLDVKVSRVIGWRDIFTVIGAVGTVVLVIDRISRISNR